MELMELYDKVVSFLKKNPGSDAMSVSNGIGVDIDNVEAALHFLGGSGRVLREKGSEGEGATYKINSAYLGWKSPSMTIPQFKLAHKEPTKVDMAIAHLAKAGASTSREIAQAMGLTAGQYPQGYLKSAISAGKIVKEGDQYRLPGTEDQVGHNGDPAHLERGQQSKSVDTDGAAETHPVENQVDKDAPAGEPFGRVTSMIVAKGVKIMVSEWGSMMLSVDDGTVHFNPGQAEVLRSFIYVTE